MPRLKLFLLGAPRLELDGNPLGMDRNKAIALLAYLAINRQSQSRESLATLFWPDYDQSRAYAYLRRTLWTLNDALGEGWLEAGRETIEFNPGTNFWLDVDAFHDLLANCGENGHPREKLDNRCLASLAEAAALYQGDFMAGFSLRDSPGFDDWQFFQAEGLRSELAGALEKLAVGNLDQKNFDGAIEVARRWLSLDSLNEAAHRQLMRAYALAGQRNAALRQYQECVHILEEELGVPPEGETSALYKRIKAGALKTEPTVSKSALPGAAPSSNLPVLPTPFVGRSEEMTEIEELIRDPQCRLLSLVGPGGIGKTRLAVQAAAHLNQLSENGAAFPFPQGVFFVALAPLSSPEFLVQAIADSLQFSFRSEDASNRTLESQRSQLIDYLRHKQMFLVMDNFEHLVSEGQLLSEILANAPRIKILVTSRERLNLPEEWVFEVGGMPFPKNGASQHLETYSAIELFVRNAQRSRVGFSLSETEKPGVVRICQLVEGVPLAIELASAWVKMLSSQEIAEEIERNLDFLATSMRGVPQRHQSLRAAFEHSWKLLSLREQRAFAWLSVFRGSFSREAAEAVIGELTGRENPNPQVLVTLSALADKSLLRRNATGSYEMHELLKLYASEKLQQNAGEQNAIQERHCKYYTAHMVELGDQMKGEGQLQAFRQIESEIGNVRAAWRWAVDQGKLDLIEQLAEALALFYEMRSRFQEGEEDFQLAVDKLRDLRAKAQPNGESGERLDVIYAFLLGALGAFWNSLGRFQEAAQLFEESLSLTRRPDSLEPDVRRRWAVLNVFLGFGAYILDQEEVSRLYKTGLHTFTELGDSWGIAMSNLVMGDNAQYSMWDYNFSRSLYQQSLETFKRTGDRWGVALAFNGLATVAYGSGKYEDAKWLSEQSLAIYRELDDRWRMISALLNQGQAATSLGDYPEAEDYYVEGLDLAREMGNRGYIGIFLDCLGYLDYLWGEYSQAERRYQESLAIYRATGNHHGEGMSLDNLGDVALARGDARKAKELYLEGLSHLQQIGELWGTTVCLKKLGNACRALGELSPAWEYYRQALEMARQIDRVAEELDVLVGMADLLDKQNELERAVELLALVLPHPGTPQGVKETALHLLVKLEDRLPAQVVAAARERGQTSDFNNVVLKLLA